MYLTRQNFWMANLIPIFACRLLHIQYVFFITIIKVHLIIIQDELQKLVSYSLNHASLGSEILQKLQIIKNLYGILHELNTLVNEMFTISITANFVRDYVHCGCDSFWTYISFTTTRDIPHFPIVLSAVNPLIFILISLKEGDSVKTEAMKIPILLHSIRKNKYEVELYKVASKQVKSSVCGIKHEILSHYRSTFSRFKLHKKKLS